MKKFTIREAGVYANGYYGDEYVNRKTVDLAIAYGWTPKTVWKKWIEEQYEYAKEALDYLNSITEEGALWEFYDGDLVLRVDDQPYNFGETL